MDDDVQETCNRLAHFRAVGGEVGEAQNTWAKYADDSTPVSNWLIKERLHPKTAGQTLECSPPRTGGVKDGRLLSAPWRRWAAFFRVDAAHYNGYQRWRDTTCQTTLAVQSASPPSLYMFVIFGAVIALGRCSWIPGLCIKSLTAHMKHFVFFSFKKANWNRYSSWPLLWSSRAKQ